VACSDIAAVSYSALFDSSLDGKVLNVTGPSTSTLTAAKMASLLTERTGVKVAYAEDPIPAVEDMAGLWQFLRAGGFDVSCDTVEEVTGRKPVDFGEMLDELARDGRLAVGSPRQ
jgi:hypothetical protein